MVQKRSGKRSLAHTIARMHDQIARFVDDYDILIFVHNVERNIVGFKRRRQLRIIDVRLIRATGKLLSQNGLESWKDGKIILRKDLLSD